MAYPTIIFQKKRLLVVILMLWVDELRVGRSLAKEKKRPFFFFQEIKRFNNTRLFRMKEVHTSEEAYTNLFLSPICIHIHYTALNKKRFLTSKYTPSVRASTDPVTLKYMGDTIRQKYFLYILLILRPFSGFSFF